MSASVQVSPRETRLIVARVARARAYRSALANSRRQARGLLHVGRQASSRAGKPRRLRRSPIGARDPAALEAPVDHGVVRSRRARVDNPAQAGVATRAGIRAQIEHWQLTVEETWDERPNGVGVEQRQVPTPRPQVGDLAGECRVEGSKRCAAARRCQPRPASRGRIERLAVKVVVGRVRRRLAGIERGRRSDRD